MTDKPTFGDMTEALGGVVVVWGMVEDAVRSMVEHTVLAAQPNPEMRGIVLAHMDFRSQLAMLRKSLHTFKPNDDWGKELDALLAEIEGKLHDRRNRYIHDLWRDDEAGGIVQIERGKGEFKVDGKGSNARLVWKEPKPAIIDELWDFFERISKVYETLLRLQTRYMEWVVEDTKRLQQESEQRMYTKLADLLGKA
jgi:hypothetical protein